MAENRITRYPSMYDKDNTRKFYLPFKLETTKTIFDLLVEAYGNYGPGFQLFEEAGKYVIYCDVSPIPGQTAILAEDWLIEIVQRALELLGRDEKATDYLRSNGVQAQTVSTKSTKKVTEAPKEEE